MVPGILFEPVRIGKLEIKNRIAMAAVNLGNLYPPNDGTFPQRVIDFYTERARGGVGLITTGVYKVENRIQRYQKDGVNIWQIVTKSGLPGFSELADRVHSLGARIFVQLSAGPGRVALGDVIDSGFQPVSASPNPAFYRPQVTCRELTVEEVESIVADFAKAAMMLSGAGIDGVEIHGHEGYLIDQFMTPLWNRRTDRYGGDLSGRLRLAVEILEAVKSAAGSDFPLTFRFGVKHFVRGPWKTFLKKESFVETGRDVEESFEIAKALQAVGYDGLHIDAGCYESFYWAHPPTYQREGCVSELIEGMKEAVEIPVIVAGKLGDPAVAERVIRRNIADMIALGRPLLADPEWPNKARRGLVEEIRPCIGCHEACLKMPRMRSAPISCSVNPACARERYYAPVRSSHLKKVLIIGGGVAGMECARTAVERGHRVVLFEKSPHLGGHLREACVPEFKKELKRLLGWYERQLERMKVEVHLDAEVDESRLEGLDYDLAVLATGSEVSSTFIPGIDQPFVTNCCEALSGKREIGGRAVILGGGMEGCETAVWLAMNGRAITVVEVLNSVASGVFESNRQMLVDMIEDHGIRVLTESTVNEVLDEGVSVIDKEGNRQFIGCDHLICAVGLRPVRTLCEVLKKRSQPFHLIGDCVSPRNLHYAILEGFNLAHYL